MGSLFAFIPLIFAGVLIIWGFLIGTRNVVIRFIGVILSLIAAVATVVVLKNFEFSSVLQILTPFISGNEIGDAVIDFLVSAENLGDAMFSICGALAAPIVFAVAFVIFAIITWVLGLIVSLIAMLIFRNKNGKKRKAAVIIPCAVIQALLTVFVLMTPVAVYGGFACEILEFAELDLQNEGSLQMPVEIIEEINSSPLTAIYRVLGGKAACKWLTSFSVNEIKGDLVSESRPIGKIVGDVLFLSKQEIAQYGKPEAERIRRIGQSISESVLLPSLAGEVVYSATDAWLYGEGDFFGVDMPDLEEAGAGIFDEAVTHLIEIFHNDARDYNAFSTDIETVANTAVILAENGVFSALGEEGDALVDKLCGGETVRDLVAEFASNPSFKVLVADVTNIGMRAIGTALNIPENAEQVYSGFTGSIAEELTKLNVSSINTEDKCQILTDVITEALENSGVEVNLDADVAKLYALMIIEDFGNYNEVTKEDISEFFKAYSEVSDSIAPPNEKTELPAIVLLSGSDSDEYSSKAYEGKGLDEIKKQSGAGLLAEIMNEILAAQSNGNADEESIRAIVDRMYTDYASAVGKDVGEAKMLADSISLTAEAVTSELVIATANMRSSESMATNSSIVTVADLLIDIESLMALLDSETAIEREADSIGSVFNSFGSIIDLLGENEGDMKIEDLSVIAENIGAILDSLSQTAALGTENTAKLLTAVMQSESIREAADLDMSSATELAKAATETDGGNVNYKETMVGIASCANVAEKLGNEEEELTREDVREFLDNMSPQTARVLKSYMTEKRVAGFGVPESKVGISTELVNNLLTEMGNKEKYLTDYESEIEGITLLFDLMNSATANDSGSKTIFNHGEEDGVIGVEAYEFTGTVLNSDMVCNALSATLKKDGVLTLDPFGLEIENTNADYLAVSAALDKHLTENSDKGESYKERIDVVRALLGVE